jgi:hypothetical protein
LVDLWNQRVAVDVPLQNIDSKDLGWKFFEWNILRGFERYSTN